MLKVCSSGNAAAPLWFPPPPAAARPNKADASADARGLRISDVVPGLYGRQLKEHFREIRDKGLIGLTSGRTPFKGRGHVPLRILELPLRDGGREVKRTLHVLAGSAP